MERASGPDGLLLLDAAYAGARSARHDKALKLPAGDYDVEELLDGGRCSVHVVRRIRRP